MQPGAGTGGDGGFTAAAGSAGANRIRSTFGSILSPIPPWILKQLFGGGGGGGTGISGGTGGTGGGVLYIEAKTIVIGASGSLKAAGIDGGQGIVNTGGGGGGAGGLVYLVYGTKSGTVVADVTGGTGGAANGTGKAGGNGSAGIKVYVQTEGNFLIVT